jgi:hypothetical protein
MVAVPAAFFVQWLYLDGMAPFSGFVHLQGVGVVGL